MRTNADEKPGTVAGGTAELGLKTKGRRPRLTHEQQIEFVVEFLRGCHRSGWTGVVKIHVNQGGISRSTKEDELHQSLTIH